MDEVGTAIVQSFLAWVGLKDALVRGKTPSSAVTLLAH